MGCGKSIIGNLLAEQLDITYVDLDSFLEEQEKATVKEIFDTKGELYFRKKERAYLEILLDQQDPIILSLGGGTPCYYNNMDYILDSKAISIYLKASLKTLTDRLTLEKTSRPLISHLESDEDLTEFIGKHLFERLSFYGKAGHLVAVDDLSLSEIVSKIKNLL